MLNRDDPRFWDPEVYLPNLRVKDRSNRIIPFTLFESQRILASVVRKAYEERKWILHLKARREGSSTFFLGVMYQHATNRTNFHGAVVGNKGGTSKVMANTLFTLHREAPDHLRGKANPRKTSTLELPELNSRVTLHGVRDGDPLRGDEVTYALATEIGFWPEQFVTAAWSAVKSAVPEKSGLLVGESTACRVGDAMQLEWLAAKNEETNWIPVFIPWTMILEYSIEPPPGWAPRPDVEGYANKYHLTLGQTYWLQSKGLPKCNNKWAVFNREYPINDEVAWQSASSCAFNLDRLVDIYADLTGGSSHQILDIEPLQIFKTKEDYSDWDQRRFLVVVDPASGFAERDYFGVHVLDLYSLEQVAEYQGHARTEVIAKMVKDLSETYRRAPIMVEANGVGEGLLTLLTMWNCNVYYRESGSPGFWSSPKQKAQAIAVLDDLIGGEEECQIIFHSPRVVAQLMSYRGAWQSIDRDAFKGHFDLVAALAMGAWYWRHVWGGVKRAPGFPKEEDRWKRLLNGLAGRPTPWGVHR